MVDPGIQYNYQIASVLIRVLELSSISKVPPATPLVVEQLADVHRLSIRVQITWGTFISLRAHWFQPFPLNEDSYRVWLNFETTLNGCPKLPPLELYLMLSPPYCLRSRGAAYFSEARICSPNGPGYSNFIVPDGPRPYPALYECSGAHFCSPNWRQRLEQGRGLPRRAKNVHVSPTGGVVTYVTKKEIVVRYYT